ncbi:MAG: MgtC/SapB family protein [Ruminococcaceae bacterium]|nr:MgtC/SapB family protein [Oscillospiraceae bacterium]
MSFVSFDYWLLLRLLTAVILGGIIGLERGGNNHEAGLRTHMILCLGAALVMLTSVCMSEAYNVPQEVMRMSAQIISGIGFLGAGSIIATGNKIRGITTAAGIWTTACVGLTVGAGYYIPACFTVVLMLFIMIILKPITKRLKANSKQHRFALELTGREVMHKLVDEMAKTNIDIRDFNFTNLPNGNVMAEIEVKFVKRASYNPFIAKLAEHEEVVGFKALE